MALHLTKIHICHPIQELAELLIPLGHSGAQLIVIHIKVIEEARKVAFRLIPLGRLFNGVEDFFQGLVEVVIPFGSDPDIAEDLGGIDKEALLLYQALPGLLRLFI